jgi:hypothetical protein
MNIHAADSARHILGLGVEGEVFLGSQRGGERWSWQAVLPPQLIASLTAWFAQTFPAVQRRERLVAEKRVTVWVVPVKGGTAEVQYPWGKIHVLDLERLL